MITSDVLQLRRAELADRLAAGRLQWERLEQDRDRLERAMRELDRQLCVVTGGIDELDRLIEEAQSSVVDDALDPEQT